MKYGFHCVRAAFEMVPFQNIYLQVSVYFAIQHLRIRAASIEALREWPILIAMLLVTRYVANGRA